MIAPLAACGGGGGDVQDDPPTIVDTDKDGVADDKDAFPNNASETKDTDKDGVGDNADAFPNDASETLDSDSDGIGNNADIDDDEDGYPDSVELSEGTDPLDPNSYPELSGLPVWLLYISTQQ